MQNENIIIQKNEIYNQNCLDFLPHLKDQSVDMIVLDPPYFQVIKEEWDNTWKTMDEYLAWMDLIAKDLERVAKYSCSLWLFGFPYQLGYIVPLFEKHGFTYRQHITIHKGIQSVAGRTSQKLKMFPVASEYIVYFHKEARHIIKKFFQDKQTTRNISSFDINSALGKATNGGGTWSTLAGKKQKNIQYPTREHWEKLEELMGPFDLKYDDYVYKFNVGESNGLTDVWNDINFYDKTYKKYHPTQKPYKLMERIIKCSTNENDVVLDVFMGSGMTGLVCKQLNRDFYGCELEEKYCHNNLLSQYFNVNK